jgi:hypothetical protein
MSSWGSGPASPTSGTVVTKAFWDANAKDLLNILRALTGGDPSVANQFLVSVDASNASWQALATSHIPNGIVTDAKLATPKVSKAGDTMTNSLTFSSDLTGVTLSGGSQVRDQAVIPRMIITAFGARLDVFDAGGSTQLMQIDNALSAPTFKGTPLSLNTHTHSYLSTGGGSVSNSILFTTDQTGIQMASGGQLRDTASPQRTLLTAAGDRFDLFNEGATVQFLQVDGSVFQYKGQGVIHSGNIGSQTVAAAATATTAGSATSAGSATTAATATNANALGGVAPAGYSLVPTSGTYNGDNSTTTVNTGLGSRLKLVILQKTSGPTSDRAMWIFIGDEAIQLTPGSGVGTVTGTFTTGSFAISLAAGTNVGGVSYRWVALG